MWWLVVEVGKGIVVGGEEVESTIIRYSWRLYERA